MASGRKKRITSASELRALLDEVARLKAKRAAIDEQVRETEAAIWRAATERMQAMHEDLAAKLKSAPEDVKVAISGTFDLLVSDPLLASAFADFAPGRTALPPTGIAAIRAVLREQPEREWRARHVHKILVERGWVSGAKSGVVLTENALNRMWRKTGELERVRPGWYRWRGEP
jgi:hypothetical protein